MRKSISCFATFLLVVAAQFSFLSPSYGISDARTVFIWSDYGFKVQITLENRTRPTSIQTMEGSQALFLKGDRVHYKIVVSADPSVPMWQEISTMLKKRYPNNKTIELSAYMDFVLKSGGVSLFAPRANYDRLTNTFNINDDLEGEFIMNANNELVLDSLLVDVSWASQDSTGNVDSEVYQQWQIISPSPADPFYLYHFDKKIAQIIGFPIVPKLSLSHASITIPLVSSSKLPVTATSLTPSVCGAESKYVIFNKVGNCKILVRQPGNDIFEAAPEKLISFSIVRNNTKSIVCSNFFRMIEVAGKNAKCPSGFDRS